MNKAHNEASLDPARTHTHTCTHPHTVNKAHKEAGLDPVHWVKAAVDAAGGGKCGGGGNNGNGTVSSLDQIEAAIAAAKGVVS